MYGNETVYCISRRYRCSTRWFCLVLQKYSITTLVENAAKLETVTKTQEATIAQLQESAQEQAALTQELSGKLAQAEKENRKIATMLANTDIVKNSIANPKAVEEKINAEVTSFFNDLKSVTAIK